MKNSKYLFYLSILLVFITCKNDSKKEETEAIKNSEKIIQEEKNNQEELKYVLNESFPVGDVRRYGIRVDGGDPIHPLTNKSTFETVLDISGKLGIELFFPKGYYREGLIIKGKENVKIKFDEAEFSGPIYIIEDENKKESQNIQFKGKVITYTKFFSSYSSEITIDELYIKSNDSLSNYKKRSAGCDIFRGTKSLTINNLIIEDLGSGDPEFLTSSAALLIHGWGANPEEITIENVHIKSSDRHGVYISGDDIIISEIKIDAYGLGEKKSMARMQDAAVGEEQNITGLWLNKCNNSTIGSVVINTTKSKGLYAVWLDAGDVGKPTIIESLTLIGGDTKLPIYAEENTNIVVKSVEK